MLAWPWKSRARPDGSSQRNIILGDIGEMVGGQYFPLCIPVVLVSEGNCFATLPIFQSWLTQISKLVKNHGSSKMILRNLNFLASSWSEGICLLLSSRVLAHQCILVSVTRPHVSPVSDARGGSAGAEVCHPTGVGRDKTSPGCLLGAAGGWGLRVPYEETILCQDRVFLLSSHKVQVISQLCLY